MWSIVPSYCRSLPSLPLSVSNSIVAWHFVYNTLPFAAIVSFSVSAFRSSLDSHQTVSFAYIRCIFRCLIFCECITLLPFFSLRTLLMLLWVLYAFVFRVTVFIRLVPFFCNHCCYFICWINIWFIAFLAFNNIDKLIFCCFVFRSSALPIIFAFYVASICNKPLPTAFLFYL